MTITPPYKNKALGLTASILALTSVLGSASIAEAATFTFSFSNVSGPVNGTVTGTVTLPDGDGTFAATSVTVNSAPAALGYPTIPFNVNLPLIAAANVFQVVAGAIVDATFAIGTAVTGVPSAFGLSSVSGSLLGTYNVGNASSGVLDSADSTLAFTATTPEPTSVITLIGVGVLGVASKLKKKA